MLNMIFESGSEIDPVKDTASPLTTFYKAEVNGLCKTKSPVPNSRSDKLIHIRGIETIASRNFIRIMLLGNSGCGKSSLIRFITENKGNYPSTNQTTNNRDGVGFENHMFELIETPGFQSLVPDSTWQELVDRVNICGGIDIFLLVINAAEKTDMVGYLALSQFERKHIEDRLLFWDRVVVVFTHADYMGATPSEQEKNVQLELHEFDADKLRQVVINAENRCLYVNSLNTELSYQDLQLRALYDQINRIQEPFPDKYSFDSLDDYDPMDPYGRYLSNCNGGINGVLDEIQKKKKKKKFLKLSSIKKIAKRRRISKETNTEEDASITSKNRGRRRSSNAVKLLINPLKRLLASTPSKAIDYDRVNSENRTHVKSSDPPICTEDIQMNRSSSLPDVLDRKDRNSSMVRKNPYAIEIYEQQKLIVASPNESPLLDVKKKHQKKEFIFTAQTSGGSDTEESDQFFTPPQSPSEM